MPHLAGTFLGISPNITTTAQGGGFGHACRVRDWRGITAKGLVYPASDGPGIGTEQEGGIGLGWSGEIRAGISVIFSGESTGAARPVAVDQYDCRAR